MILLKNFKSKIYNESYISLLMLILILININIKKKYNF